MNGLESVLGPERSWLTWQPEFRNGWERGQAWVESFITDCEVRYANLYAGPSVVEGCRLKLCEALVYHWRQAGLGAEGRDGGVEGTWVVRTVRAGLRPTTPAELEREPRSLGGDPFRDVVIAASIIAGGRAASEIFDREHRSPFEQRALAAGLGDDSTAEWGDFVLRLLSPRGPGRPAPLDQFRGYTSLRHWLHRVAANFLADAYRRIRARRDAEQVFSGLPGVEADRAVFTQSFEAGFELVRSALLRAIPRLDDRSRLILARDLVHGETNRQIGRRLGLSEGQVSRLRQTAYSRLAEQLAAFVNDSSFLPESPTAAESWREVLTDLPPTLLGDLIRRPHRALSSNHSEGASRPRTMNDDPSDALAQPNQPATSVAPVNPPVDADMEATTVPIGSPAEVEGSGDLIHLAPVTLDYQPPPAMIVSQISPATAPRPATQDIPPSETVGGNNPSGAPLYHPPLPFPNLVSKPPVDLPDWFKPRPEDFHVASLGRNSAGAARELLDRRRDDGNAPTLVCLDARRARDFNEVASWLQSFDAELGSTHVTPGQVAEALAEAQDAEDDEDAQVEAELAQFEVFGAAIPTATDLAGGDFYLPRHVVLIDEDRFPEMDRQFRETSPVYDDISLIPAAPGAGDPMKIYKEYAASVLGRAFSGSVGAEEEALPSERAAELLAAELAQLSDEDRAEWEEIRDQQDLYGRPRGS